MIFRPAPPLHPMSTSLKFIYTLQYISVDLCYTELNISHTSQRWPPSFKCYGTNHCPCYLRLNQGNQYMWTLRKPSLVYSNSCTRNSSFIPVLFLFSHKFCVTPNYVISSWSCWNSLTWSRRMYIHGCKSVTWHVFFVTFSSPRDVLISGPLSNLSFKKQY